MWHNRVLFFFAGRDAFRWVSCIVPARHETHRNATRERPCSRSSSDRSARRRDPRRAQAKARSPQGRTLESNHFSWSDRACQLHSLRADDGAIASSFCYLWASLPQHGYVSPWTCLGIRALGHTVRKAVFATQRARHHRRSESKKSYVWRQRWSQSGARLAA